MKTIARNCSWESDHFSAMLGGQQVLNWSGCSEFYTTSSSRQDHMQIIATFHYKLALVAEGRVKWHYVYPYNLLHFDLNQIFQMHKQNTIRLSACLARVTGNSTKICDPMKEKLQKYVLDNSLLHLKLSFCYEYLFGTLPLENWKYAFKYHVCFKNTTAQLSNCILCDILDEKLYLCE